MTLIWLALSSIVWGAALVGVGLAFQSFTRASGVERQWLWRGLAFLLMLRWFVAPFASLMPRPDFTLPALMPELPAQGVSVVFTAPMGEASVAVPQASLPWPEIVLALIVAGWAWRVFAARRASRALRNILAHSRTVVQGPALAAIRIWSQQLGLKRRPELRVTEAAISPFSFGVARPVICLPDGMEQQLSPPALDLVVGHECLHVARGDGWRRPLERFFADVLWFNPFAWRMRRELDLARELACDEAVLDRATAPADYARVLRDVASLAAGLAAGAPAASMSLSGGGRVLVLRVKRAMRHAKRKPGRAALAGALFLALAGAPVAIAQAVLVNPPPPPPAIAPPAPPAESRVVAQIAPPAPPAPSVPPAPAAPEAAPAPPAPPAVAELEAAPAPPAPAARSANAVIRAPFDAHVSKVASSKDLGLYVVIDQIDSPQGFGGASAHGCMVQAPHLSKAMVKQGQSIRAGEVIGERANGDGNVTAECKSFNADQIPGPTIAAPADHPNPTAALAHADKAVLDQPAHLSSPYGYRVDPFTQMKAWHEGVDLASPLDSAVHAPVAGKVTFAGKKTGYGYVVEISAADGYSLRFAHLGALKVKDGDATKAGDAIGTVGMDDASTGSHVHLEVFWKGKGVDPQQVKGLMLIAAK
jgi:murein DD-endopeptidase MepM/ murein hydrolase activator NlpD/beta-lactamase regulating signal transducer with metallopeptidase domain